MTGSAALERLCYVNSHIAEIVKAEKEAGKKVVGILPVYAPAELVHAAGIFPVGCWGGQTAIHNAPTYLPSFACSIMQSIVEMACNGTYSDLDAFLISTPCDTLRCTGQNLKSAAPLIKPIYCIAPTNSKSEAGVVYYQAEMRRVVSQLEELSGNKITKKAINDSISLYNENRLVLQRFAELTGQKPGIITAVQRHAVMRSRLYMDIAEHTACVREINAALEAAPNVPFEGKKLFLAGITAEPDWFLSMLDELGAAVVGDELAQEWRQIATLVPDGIDPLERLARQHQNRTACSLILDAGRSRSHSIADRAEKLKADGVLYCQMKFCDPEEQDYPGVRNQVEKKNIPVLNIEIDQNSETAEQYRTRLQAFFEAMG